MMSIVHLNQNEILDVIQLFHTLVICIRQEPQITRLYQSQ